DHAGLSSGTPAAREAWRAGFMPWFAVSTWPSTTSDTSLASTFARCSAAVMATRPSSCAGVAAKAPLKEPTGVRAAETITMSVIASDSQLAKSWSKKEVLQAPIAQAAREFQALLLPSAGENSLFVLQCGGGSGSLPPLSAFAGAKRGCEVADGHDQNETDSAT